MEYRNVGRSGLQVSVVGLGCNNFGMRIDAEAAQAVVDRAIDEGITFFDTAEMYGRGASEQMLGKALGARRRNVIVATKFGKPAGGLISPGAGSRRYIVQALERSLTNLGTDYIDLYMVHFPDPRTPFEETARALDDLIRAGKVRYAGISNVPGWQVADAHYVAKLGNLAPFVSVENEWSLLERGVEKDVLPAATRYGLGVIPYFPLASGFLTGKYRRGEAMPQGGRLSEGVMAGMARKYMTERTWAILERAEAFARERGRSVLELAVGWLLAHPVVPSVISGATLPEQITQNVAAAGWRLTDDERAAVDGLAV